MKKLLILSFLILTLGLKAGEGMWLPLFLGALNESEMKSMGMKISADDIYSINHGSLKDAVISFGGFCTGEIVSDQGLIFTNHHCGFDAIQNLSTVENNLLTNGFWAYTLAEEKPAQGLFATFIVKIEDVTQMILGDITQKMDAKSQQIVIDKNINKLKESYQRQYYQDIIVKPFFEGNQYYLFVTETYNDVRYVGSPPESIGKFGADTDNWVWPRHTGDFSVFRVYAGPDNRPAQYSPNNKPLKPRYFFPISLDGVQPGDFTMIFGFPGKTNEYLPSYVVKQTMEVVDPARIDVRGITLGIWDEYMRQDEATRLAYATKYAGQANSWKKWVGEAQGLRSKHAVQAKEKQEEDFTMRVSKITDPENLYANLLPSMKTLTELLDPVLKNRTILVEILGGNNIEVFKVASLSDRLVKAYTNNGEKGFNDEAVKWKGLLQEFFKEYNPQIDQEVYTALMDYARKSLSPDYQASVPDQENIFTNSVLTSSAKLMDAMGLGGEQFSKIVSADKAYQVYLKLKNELDTKLTPKYNMLIEQANAFQKNYMKALMEMYPEKRFWPDANNTLRVSYGQVQGYSPQDAKTYYHQTYLDGVMEKYVPGDYEFDVHPKLIELYNSKDYGQYGENGRMPVCFIGSNHTTGGNSGSPALDAYGNLIGINFDRVWEGTMSDLYYDPSICRNIMVDARYVLFVIDKFAGDTRLINELKLVHPKAAPEPVQGKKKKKKSKATARVS